jgi:DNA-directed RNA polymerase specialized sigma24 family protein
MGAGEQARRAVIRDLYPALLRQVKTACRKGGLYQRAADADDILQDVCVVILTKWQTLRSEHKLGAWLGAIIAHRVVDVHRRERRLVSVEQVQQAGGALPPQLLEPSSSPNPAHEDCVAKVLEQLRCEGPARAGSIRTIEMIEFIVDHGADTAALARFLECSEGAGKERKRYALQKFRELCLKICESAECAASPAR